MAFGSFDKNHSSTLAEINMVPLIDVMLVLLVIFIITAPMMSHSLNINLPQVSAKPITEDPKVIDLAVDAYGQIYWNEQPVAQDSLRARFVLESRHAPQPEIRIRADLDTRYETLAQIMASARSGGMKRIGFITRPAHDAVTPKHPPADAPLPSHATTALAAAKQAPSTHLP